MLMCKYLCLNTVHIVTAIIDYELSISFVRNCDVIWKHST